MTELEIKIDNGIDNKIDNKIDNEFDNEFDNESRELPFKSQFKLPLLTCSSNMKYIVTYDKGTTHDEGTIKIWEHGELVSKSHKVSGEPHKAHISDKKLLIYTLCG